MARSGWVGLYSILGLRVWEGLGFDAGARWRPSAAAARRGSDPREVAREREPEPEPEPEPVPGLGRGVQPDYLTEGSLSAAAPRPRRSARSSAPGRPSPSPVSTARLSPSQVGSGRVPLTDH